MLSSIPSTVASMRRELNEAGSDLVNNEDVLRSVLNGCGDCIKILDLEGRLQFMSEGGKRVMEVDDFSKLKGCPWPDFWAGAGNDDAKRAIALAKTGRVGRFKGAANTARGTPRQWDVQVSPIFGHDGHPSHLLSISRDITEEWRALADLKESVERQALLSGELQHRIKNTIAMIGAIANQTMRGDDVAAARDAFSSRLMTLSKAHDILTQTSWSGAAIADVVDGALAPHRTTRNQISATGPSLNLQSKQALALSLAIHELATNAVKYGALSAEGAVAIRWWEDDIDGTASFHFTWAESGGPTVVEPLASEKGFGSRLIDRLLANDFKGKVTTQYGPDGVVCSLTAPMSVLTEEPHEDLSIGRL